MSNKTKRLFFTKMHGAGNDYIYIDATTQSVNNPEELSKRLSHRHTGVGADGLVLIAPSVKAHYAMRIFNADGSEALMCGNALRCVGKYLYDNKMIEGLRATIETKSGLRHLQLQVGEEGVENVTVDMGEPLLANVMQVNTADGHLNDVIINVAGMDYSPTYVCMGNPHVVCFVDDVANIKLHEVGSFIESHELFPQKTNVEFAQIINPSLISMRVWERGSGETQACGSGACATLVAACVKEHCIRKAQVEMPGGTLMIEWNNNDNHIYMTGEVVTVFTGVVEVECDEII